MMAQRSSEDPAVAKFAGKGKGGDGERFAWHACFHRDAWTGLLGLSPAAVGVYWRIILMMYIKRAALVDSDAALAHQCECDVRTYKRAKIELLAAGRIEIDDDNGLIYDKRALQELVASERLSVEQSERAKRKGKARKARLVLAVSNPPRDRSVSASLSDLRPILGVKSDRSRVERFETPLKTGEKKPAGSLPSQSHRKKPKNTGDNPKSGSDLEARRSPHESGGAQQQRARKKWLADQRKRLGVAPDKPKKGKE